MDSAENETSEILAGKRVVLLGKLASMSRRDAAQVATARRLAQLLAGGTSPRAIEQKLEALSRFLPDVQRPLAQLSVIVEGNKILLRQGDGLIEPGGQLRFNFETPHEGTTEAELLFDQLDEDVAAIIEGDESAAINETTAPMSVEAMTQIAAELEEDGQLTSAAEMVRAANLGCVLAEMGQIELAVAALEGALVYHSDYADAHYHLARTLDEIGQDSHAADHWREFLDLAPNSPWAEEARQRLEK